MLALRNEIGLAIGLKEKKLLKSLNQKSKDKPRSSRTIHSIAPFIGGLATGVLLAISNPSSHAVEEPSRGSRSRVSWNRRSGVGRSKAQSSWSRVDGVRRTGRRSLRWAILPPCAA